MAASSAAKNFFKLAKSSRLVATVFFPNGASICTSSSKRCWRFFLAVVAGVLMAREAASLLSSALLAMLALALALVLL